MSMLDRDLRLECVKLVLEQADYIATDYDDVIDDADTLYEYIRKGKS